MTVYQIVCEGRRSYFSDVGKFHSQKVYQSYPLEREIAEFKALCCGDGPYDLDPERASTRVAVLELMPGLPS